MDQLSLTEIISTLYNSILKRGVSEEELTNRLSILQPDTNPIDLIFSLLEELLNSQEFLAHHAPNADFHEITDSDVFYAFKFLLGRLPEGAHIYESKKKIPGSNALIEEIISSDEFKNNQIIKNLISIRRKPKHLDSTFKTGFARIDKRFLVLSGCQGRMIADLLQSGVGLAHVENIFLNNENYNRFISTKGQSLSHLFSQADIIFTQKKGVYDILKELPETCKKARLIPLIEYTGFHPDQCYLTDLNSGNIIVGPLGEYHSTILAAAYFAGLNVDAAAHSFNATTYEAFEYDHFISKSKQSLISQELTTKFPLAQMFEQWEKTGKWMRTVNHPKKHILNDLVRFAIEQEGLSYIKGSDEFVTDDLASNVDWPAYGSNHGRLEMHDQPELNFKLPRAFTPTVNSAMFLNLETYIELFYRSMSEYSADKISCHQLGRPIDLNRYIEYLKSPFIYN